MGIQPLVSSLLSVYMQGPDCDPTKDKDENKDDKDDDKDEDDQDEDSMQLRSIPKPLK